MGEKVGEKEKFSFWRFGREKVRKVIKLRKQWAAPPQHCLCIFTQGRKSCKSAASRYAP